MSWSTPDKVHRTAKILIDAGLARDEAEAAEYLRSLVLQVDVGPGVGEDPAAQAALATAVNVGIRAFHGGVRVRLASDPVLSAGWTRNRRASEVVEVYGGVVVEHLEPAHRTLVIGVDTELDGPALHCYWRGWSGGVVQHAAEAARDHGIEPAGVLAAALGVSESFQQAIASNVAGRRDVGLSLWRPDEDWRSCDSGPALKYLPRALWLLGLGHLGQAYAWTLGLLPYDKPEEVTIGLVDFDIVVDGNTATQLLVTGDDAGQQKTRVVAGGLGGLGMQTRIVERAFDGDFHPVHHANPERNEPFTALAGFHDAPPRRLLTGACFDTVVDAGLGAGPREYLDMVIQTFPDAGDSAQAFREDGRSRSGQMADAYEQEIARQVEAGALEADARCGMLDIAGVTVGAAFVGAVASTLVIADILRLLHDGQSYSVMALDLRAPSAVEAALMDATAAPRLPAWTPARCGDTRC